jgi:hypothetical protein
LHPALDSGDDAIRMGGPHEGFGIAIGLSEKAVDCALSSTTEQSTPRLSLRRVSFEKNPSIALSHEHDFGVKWKTKRGMPLQPCLHLGVLVGGVVVEDHVDDPADRDLRLDRVEEADELLMPPATSAQAKPQTEARLEFILCHLLAGRVSFLNREQPLAV